MTKTMSDEEFATEIESMVKRGLPAVGSTKNKFVTFNQAAKKMPEITIVRHGSSTRPIHIGRCNCCKSHVIGEPISELFIGTFTVRVCDPCRKVLKALL